MKAVFNFKDKLFYLFLLLVITIVYFASFYSGPLWDDDFFIFKNQQIISNNNPFVFFNPFDKDHRAWPLGYFIFWVCYQVIGTKWLLYKALNIILHFINSVLVYKLFRRSFSKLAFIPTLLFAIHPLHVETVSWIFQFNTMLASTTMLISLLYWFNFLENRDKPNYLRALTFFVTSLFIKSYAVFIPFYFLFLMFKRNEKNYILIVPFFIASLIAGLSTVRGVISSPLELTTMVEFHTKKLEPEKVVLKAPLAQFVENIEYLPEDVKDIPLSTIKESLPPDTGVEVKSEIEGSSILDVSVIDDITLFIELAANRYILMSRNFFYYLKSYMGLTNRLLFAPQHDPTNITQIISSLFVFTGFIALCFLACTHSIKMPKTKPYLIMLLCSFIPISGLVYVPFMKYSSVSDHWTYMMLIPVSYITYSLLNYIFLKFGELKKVSYIFVVLILFFSFKTMKYGTIFNDHEVLFMKNIDAYPQNVFLYRYLAKFYDERGEEQRSRRIIERGLMLHPNDIGLIIDLQKK